MERASRGVGVGVGMDVGVDVSEDGGDGGVYEFVVGNQAAYSSSQNES